MDIELIRTIQSAGQPTARLPLADGAQALILPYGGRVLGLYASESGANFLWTNPALGSATSATRLFTSDQWLNTGGDRTWLAPEVELFIGDVARPVETYVTPRSLDPGHWTLEPANDGELSLTCATRLQLHRTGGEVGVRIGKSFRPAGNPLRGDSAACANLDYAGYALVTTLELDPVPGASVRLGIWNLLQLPQPGVMLIPTRERVRHHCVFGALSAGELSVEPRAALWAMKAGPSANAKIAVKATSLTGRAGHVRQHASAGIAEMVVRQFAVDPCGDYVDALWAPPYETGWAFQACCVRAGQARFNELEYHAPAASAIAGGNRSRDESCVWAFRGPVPAIAEAAKTLLDVEEETVLSVMRYWAEDAR